MRHKPHQMHFEADNGGHEYADNIDKQLREKGFKTNITSKRADNQSCKLARIIQFAPDIKRAFYFLDEEHRDEQYQAAIDDLITFVQIGKNVNDDSPDALSQTCAFLSNGIYAQCEAMERPW